MATGVEYAKPRGRDEIKFFLSQTIIVRVRLSISRLHVFRFISRLANGSSIISKRIGNESASCIRPAGHALYVPDEYENV